MIKQNHYKNKLKNYNICQQTKQVNKSSQNSVDIHKNFPKSTMRFVLKVYTKTIKKYIKFHISELWRNLQGKQ